MNKWHIIRTTSFTIQPMINNCVEGGGDDNVMSIGSDVSQISVPIGLKIRQQPEFIWLQRDIAKKEKVASPKLRRCMPKANVTPFIKKRLGTKLTNDSNEKQEAKEVPENDTKSENDENASKDDSFISKEDHSQTNAANIVSLKHVRFSNIKHLKDKYTRESKQCDTSDNQSTTASDSSNGPEKAKYPRPAKRSVSSLSNTGPKVKPQMRRRPVSAPNGDTSDTESVGDRRSECSVAYTSPGMGHVYLRMPDIIRPNTSRTLTMTYSSAVLSENSKHLSDDTIRMSMKRDLARDYVVNRIERRLEGLDKKREVYSKFQEEQEKLHVAENATDLIMDACVRCTDKAFNPALTVSELKEQRKDRIKQRTMLLPENFRTANYLLNLSGKYMANVKKTRYLRKTTS